MSYYSKVFYTITSGTASSKQFQIAFGLESGPATTNSRPYIHTSHIKAKVNGAPVTDFTISEAVNPSTLTFGATVTLNVGAVVEIYRETPRDAGSRAVDFEDASVLTEADLDLAQIHSLFIAQELLDFVALFVPPGGSIGQLLAKASGVDFDVNWIDNPLTTPNAANAGGLLSWGPSGNPTVVTPEGEAVQHIPSATRGDQGAVVYRKGGIVTWNGQRGPLDSEGHAGDLWIWYGSGNTPDDNGYYPGTVALKVAEGGGNWQLLFNYTGVGGGTGGTGIDSFLELTDTPNTYGNNNLKFVKVNAAGTALAFGPFNGMLESLEDVDYASDTGVSAGDILVYDGDAGNGGKWRVSPGIQTADHDAISQSSLLVSHEDGVFRPLPSPSGADLYLKSTGAASGAGLEWATGSAGGTGGMRGSVALATNYLINLNTDIPLPNGNVLGDYIYWDLDGPPAPASGATWRLHSNTGTGFSLFSNYSAVGPVDEVTITESGYYRIAVTFLVYANDVADAQYLQEYYPVEFTLQCRTGAPGVGYGLWDYNVLQLPSPSGGTTASTSGDASLAVGCRLAVTPYFFTGTGTTPSFRVRAKGLKPQGQGNTAVIIPPAQLLLTIEAL